MEDQTRSSLTTIEKIAKRLAPKYTFGYYDVEDITQEAIIIGLEALPRYKESMGPLENFMAVHISNRLKTFKRDNYYRPMSRCSICEDSSCDSCQERLRKIEVKKSLAAPIDIESLDSDSMRDSCGSTPMSNVEKMEMEELSTLIDTHLDIALRADYLKMKDGLYVPKVKRKQIEETIIEIVSKYGK